MFVPWFHQSLQERRDIHLLLYSLFWVDILMAMVTCSLQKRTLPRGRAKQKLCVRSQFGNDVRLPSWQSKDLWLCRSIRSDKEPWSKTRSSVMWTVTLEVTQAAVRIGVSPTRHTHVITPEEIRASCTSFCRTQCTVHVCGLCCFYVDIESVTETHRERRRGN